MPNGLISGLEDEEIGELIDIQHLIRDDPTFFDDSHDFDNIPCCSSTKDLKDNGITNEIKGKLDTLQSSSIPHTTAEHQKRYSNKFIQFLKDKKLSTDLTNLPTTEIADYLRYFYSELRANDGKLYSPATLICIRAALFRFMKQPPLNLPYNIIDDKEFYNANQVLKAMVKRNKEEGGTSKHFDAIESADISTLASYFDRQNPDTLKEEVYFCIVYYLGTRGREWIRYLKKSNIIIQHDSSGCEYVEIIGLNVIQKNCQPTLKARQDDLKQSRIYSSNNPCSCPVQAIKLLLSKLPPECEHVFYKKNIQWESQKFWYNSRLPLGVQTIGNFEFQQEA